MKKRVPDYESFVNESKIEERNWKLTLNIIKEWEALEKAVEDDNDIQKELKSLVKKLETYSTKVGKKIGEYEEGQYEDLIQYLIQDTLDEFDGEWDVFYDFCDLNDIWVKTF